jgi:hypothetical protein
MNRIRMVFKEEESAKQLKTDLESLGSVKDNLCQLVFPYDYESKKMTFPDGSVKTLEEGLGCPAGEYWGTKWGTYNLSIDVDIDDEDNDGYILEYDFDTAWGPVSTEVLSGLFKKYDLTSIVNNYWEPGCCFAGTRYSCDSEGICDTEYDYNLIYVEDVDYASFKKRVAQHHVDQLTVKQLKALFKEFKKYECMYTSFEKRAYEAFVNEEEQPMFNTFIANNLS